MPRWLDKATQVLRRHEVRAPQPFDVGCACGNLVSGVRRTSFQSVPCTRCGDRLFVLPADVYPVPKIKKKTPAKSPPAKAPVRPAGAREPGTVAAPTSDELAVVSRPAKTALRERVGHKVRAAASFPRTLFTPLRSIVLAIIAVVGATGYFVWDSRMRDQAAHALHGHLEAGDEALRNGNAPLAADEFRQAVLAVDRLGREDSESQRIRQKARELQAATNLCRVSLYEICERVRKAVAAKDAGWAQDFDRQYRSSWVVVEGDVVQDTGPDGVRQAVVRYPLRIDDLPFIIDAQLPALDALTADGKPRRVIFAGQLASLAKEGRAAPVWVLRLKDATAFAWTAFDTYQALGLGSDALRTDDETRRLLDAQAEAVGVKP